MRRNLNFAQMDPDQYSPLNFHILRGVSYSPLNMHHRLANGSPSVPHVHLSQLPGVSPLQQYSAIILGTNNHSPFECKIYKRTTF